MTRFLLSRASNVGRPLAISSSLMTMRRNAIHSTPPSAKNRIVIGTLSGFETMRRKSSSVRLHR